MAKRQNNKIYVWQYTVHWYRVYWDTLNEGHKYYAKKEDAIAFARGIYKQMIKIYGKHNSIKPSIVRHIANRASFRSDVECEYLKDAEVARIGEFDKFRVVRWH